MVLLHLKLVWKLLKKLNRELTQDWTSGNVHLHKYMYTESRTQKFILALFVMVKK